MCAKRAVDLQPKMVNFEMRALESEETTNRSEGNKMKGGKEHECSIFIEREKERKGERERRRMGDKEERRGQPSSLQLLQ